MPRSDGRGDDCASDLTFDLLLAGDLPPDTTKLLDAHLVTCAACAARFAGVKTGFEVPPAPFDRLGAPTPLRRRNRRVITGLVGVVACAAAIALFVRSRGEQRGDDTRVKGGVKFTLYIKHGTQMRAAGPTEIVAPGDQLQLTYTANASGHLAMVGRDGAGVVSVYFPEERTDAWPATPGTAVSLPRSTILDDVLGLEMIRVLHCPRPFALASVRDLAFVPQPDCTVEQFALDKRVTR